MTAEPATTSVDITDYLDVAKRRWRLIAITAVMVLLLIVGYTISRPTTYLSRAEIALPDPGLNQTPGQIQADTATEIQVMKSDEVARRAAALIEGAATVGVLKAHLSVAVPTEARIISIAFSSDSARTAQRGAQGFSQAYIAYRSEQAQAIIDTQVASINRSIADIDRDIESNQEVIRANPPSSSAYQQAQSALDGLQNQRTEFSGNLAGVKSQHVTGGQVITPAILPDSPVRTGLVRNSVAGLIAGLVLGIALAFVRERFDRQVRESADIEQVVGVATLGAVPTLPEGSRRAPASLVAVHAADGSHADAFRRIRTSFLIATEAADARIVGVTSAIGSEGKSTVAANLAVTLHRSGRRVLLISADLRRPSIEDLFQVANSPGLVDVVLNELQLTDAIVESRGVEILPEGRRHQNPTDLLQSPQMRSVLRQAAALYDIVLVDTPPVLAVADVLGMATMLDGVILVVSLAETTEGQVAEAELQLRGAGATIIGSIINRSSASTVAYDRYARKD